MEPGRGRLLRWVILVRRPYAQWTPRLADTESHAVARSILCDEVSETLREISSTEIDSPEESRDA